MKDLFLVRHAKSSWADDQVCDHDRPLSPRGESQLAPLGKALLGAGAFRSEVCSSDARRARETLAGILPMSSPQDRCQVLSELYTFDYRRLRFWLQKRQNASAITLVGHNPALLELAQWLLKQPLGQLPTGSFIHLRLPIKHWHKLEQGKGKLIALLTPADYSYAHFARKRKKKADTNGTDPAKDIPAALQHQLDRLRKLERGVTVGLDDEFLHQYRIAIRRTRAIAESVQELTGDKPLAKSVSILKRHARATGPLRDLHVFLQDLPKLCGQDPKGLEALKGAVEKEATDRHKKLVKRLESKRYQDSMNDWLSVLNSRRFYKLTATLRSRDIRKALERRIKGFNKRSSALDEASADEDIHQLRKQLKRIRYLMELDAERWKRELKALKARQQLYGQFQDLHVQLDLLKRFHRATPEKSGAALTHMIQTLEVHKADTRQQILALGGLDGAPLRHPVL